MERLRELDYRAVIRFLSEIYAPGDPGQFPDRLVRSLDALIPSEVASYDEMNTALCTSSDRFSQTGILTPELMRDIWPRVMHEHPVLMLNQRSGDLRAHRISEFYSQPKLHDLALYREFYKKGGIEDGLCKGIRASGPVVIGCAFHRTRRSFTDRHSLIFDLIGPHITQGWRNSRAAARVQTQMRKVGQAVEALNCGIVALSFGRPNFLSQNTKKILEEFFGRIPDRRLPEAVATWYRSQKQRFAPNHCPRPLEPLVVENGTERLIVRLLLETGEDLLLLEKQALAPDRSQLSKLGLSRRETEVLLWVSKGKTNVEIGLMLEISPRTVQKHLEHIFSKLGVETRTAAAMAISGTASA